MKVNYQHSLLSLLLIPATKARIGSNTHDDMEPMTEITLSPKKGLTDLTIVYTTIESINPFRPPPAMERDLKEATVAEAFDGDPSHIVGGIRAMNDRYPYLCDVMTGFESGGYLFLAHTCGGTLITENVLLTAAHCCDSAQYVQCGKDNLNPYDEIDWRERLETFAIEKIKQHGRWNRNTFENDAAVFKLSGYSSLNPVKLGLKRNVKVGEDLTVTGWGKTSIDAQSSSEFLMETDVASISKDSCDNIYGGYVKASMMCAFTENKDACQGDSGGPLVAKDLDDPTNSDLDCQVGIVSWGYLCAEYPGVYTKLNNRRIRNFLNHAVCNSARGLSPESKFCRYGRLSNIV